METDSVFDGIKVLDFTWAAAGPLVTKHLADFGATVVKLESANRPDVMRVGSPYKDNIAGLDRSGMYIIFNANKYGISLNLNHPKGIDIAKRLVSWCDIVAENFTPGTLERWGLEYENLKKIKPDIIMIRSSMEGSSGPRVGRRLTGHQGVGLAGFSHLTGFPDRDPSQPFAAYTDYVGPRFMITALISALDYRRRTGKGQCMEVSQYEASLHFLSPAILDYTVNGRETDRAGNSCPHAAPHSTYRCQGDDRWCAITVFTDKEWAAFCKAIGNPKWTTDPRFATLLSRKSNEDALNRLVEEWTMQFPAEEVMQRLQAAGVAAGVVRTTADLHDDSPVWEQGQLWSLKHAEVGPTVHLGQGVRLSQTPAKAQRPAPCIGQDSEYVMTQILGITTEEFAELLNEGVFD
ncbi:CaiB/BaiF CoA transferase family protein [Chloroflexota bacterium]